MISDEDYRPSPKEIDSVLVFLPIFERQDFIPSRINKPSGQLPYHVFAEELERFHFAVYDNGFISSFKWPVWQEEAQRYLKQPELIREADLQIIRKLITVHVRKERFCEGHLPAMVENGHILEVLRRLKELRVILP
jgi:hypothetical protein